MKHRNNINKKNISFMLGVLFATFLCSCVNDHSSAKIRKSFFYIGNDGISIGPSFEASASSPKGYGNSEIKYENKKIDGKEYFYMATGIPPPKKQLGTQSTINLNVTNSRTTVDNSTYLQTSTSSNIFKETTNLIDASRSMIDKKAVNNDSSITINSNNSNSKVNSENKKP